MKHAASVILLLAGVAELIFVASAGADSIRIGVYSQKASPSKARIGASVQVSQHVSGGAARPSGPRVPASGGGSATPAVPALQGSSPLSSKTHPAGPVVFSYTTLEGQRCIYVAAGSGPCHYV